MNNSVSDPVHGVCVTAGFFSHAADGWEPVSSAQGDEAVVFAVECRRDHTWIEPSLDCVIELWRGEELRDVQVGAVQIGESWQATYRLSWGGRTGASSRLRCRVQVANEHVGWWELLLLRNLTADAQGRLIGDTTRRDSDETILLYQREYHALLGDVREKNPPSDAYSL